MSIKKRRMNRVKFEQCSKSITIQTSASSVHSPQTSSARQSVLTVISFSTWYDLYRVKADMFNKCTKIFTYQLDNSKF